MKINPIILHSTLLLISLSYFSCSKDNCGDGKVYRLITNEDKNLIPYIGREELKFINNTTNDTLTFVGDTNWTYYTNREMSGGDCPIESICEGRGIAFLNFSQGKKIIINQLYYLSGGAGIEINYNDLFTAITYLPFAGLPSYDSSFINGQMYHNIRLITGKVSKPKDVGCWFTKDDGIIKIYTNKGDTLTKIR